MFAPSKAMPVLTPPRLKNPKKAPSLARSFVTEFGLTVTQMLAPS
jgi:hypothetical protein